MPLQRKLQHAFLIGSHVNVNVQLLPLVAGDAVGKGHGICRNGFYRNTVEGRAENSQGIANGKFLRLRRRSFANEMEGCGIPFFNIYDLQFFIGMGRVGEMLFGNTFDQILVKGFAGVHFINQVVVIPDCFFVFPPARFRFREGSAEPDDALGFQFFGNDAEGFLPFGKPVRLVN